MTCGEPHWMAPQAASGHPPEVAHPALHASGKSLVGLMLMIDDDDHRM